MEDGQFREAESEEQKSLPFNFRAPRLQLTQDKSQARICWQSQGQIIADHKQQMVNSIGKDNRTSLYSSWMAPTDAQRKLQTLLADLGKGTSWLNMYKMTAKACEAIQPLPHNFAMPKVEPHLSDKKLARIHWQQRSRDVSAHTEAQPEEELGACLAVVDAKLTLNEEAASRLLQGTTLDINLSPADAEVLVGMRAEGIHEARSTKEMKDDHKSKGIGQSPVSPAPFLRVFAAGLEAGKEFATKDMVDKELHLWGQVVVPSSDPSKLNAVVKFCKVKVIKMRGDPNEQLVAMLTFDLPRGMQIRGAFHYMAFQKGAK